MHACRSTLEDPTEYFLTQAGAPRSRLIHAKASFPSPQHWQRHREFVVRAAPRIRDVLAMYRRDLNVLVARGVWRMFRIAEAEYRRTLDAHAMLDFSDLLATTLQLLRQMDEFARSRYRLESRYHHVLLDEFQDTSRAQWELVSLLVQAWGEGAGLAQVAPLQPSIFIVGDAKQSIYGFRDADTSVLEEAARYIGALRPDGRVRRSISRSFRSVPALLSFVNDLCEAIDKTGRADAFRYQEQDRFPLDAPVGHEGDALGAIVGDDPRSTAENVAGEIARLLTSETTVRDVGTGLPRTIRPADIAILFRTRDGHRELEDALERRGVAAYVYKGLGFFDSDEIRDVLAVLWHLAEPLSNLRAAAWLRSGFVRLSDEGLRRLGPSLADTLLSPSLPPAAQTLDEVDATTLGRARAASAMWRSLVDRIPPADLLDQVLRDSAYAFEMRGRRFRQALENVKKIRGFVRRVQNNGYATLARIVAYLDRLAVGDESNAAIDAADAVSLMTVHAAKGLEFPVVFVVNLTRGTGGMRSPIRLTDTGSELSVSIGDFRSALDEDESERQKEETKRLLYVAVTRARERLYLSGTTSDGRLQPAPGSLAEVLPASLVAQLGRAANAPSIQWQPGRGTIHVFRGCVTSVPSQQVSPLPDAPASHSVELDFEPLPGHARPLPEAASAPPRERASPRLELSASEEDTALSPGRLRGRIVHRLIERLGLAAVSTEGEELSALVAQAEQLIREEERAAIPSLKGLVMEACQTYCTLSRHDAVRSLYSRGRAYHELPFSFLADGVLVRGTVDCVVSSETAEGSSDTSAATLAVLEFKTGQPDASDRNQTILYRRALESTFPGASVEAWLVYPDCVESV